MKKCGYPECIDEPAENRMLCKAHESKDIERSTKFGELRRCRVCPVWFRSKTSDYCEMHREKLRNAS